MNSPVYIYSWDFYGPRAEGTARHFLRHLEEFLERHDLRGCELDTSSDGEGHVAARCRAPLEAQTSIERALRPQRREPG